MDVEQILAFRLARSGLASRHAAKVAEAAACPVSDFSRDAALMAFAARHEDLTREAYDEAVDSGDLVLAHVVRGAIHAVAPDEFALYGRALVSSDDDELGLQLGRQVQRLAAEKGFAPTDALNEVAEATSAALGHGRELSKNELHQALRDRVGADLMPWCKGCKSHHVAPMLWRYGCVKAGARVDSKRRYLLGNPRPEAPADHAVNRFLHFLRPGHPRGLRRLDRSGRTPSQSSLGKGPLQKPNRPLLAPEAELRKRLFRPVASPGAVLKNGRLAGLWRVKAKGKKAEITVEKLGRLARKDLEDEARQVARLRGSTEPLLVVI